jgi:hypothetical protein
MRLFRGFLDGVLPKFERQGYGDGADGNKEGNPSAPL